MSIKQNITSLQSLLEQVNALPEAGGVELPELTNEGSASDLLSGKQLIDGDGNKVTGTFSIDAELTAQDELIAQIQAAVDGLPEAGGSGNSFETVIGTVSASGPIIGNTTTGTVYYIDGNSTYATSNIIGIITVMKGSIIVGCSSDGVRASGGVKQIESTIGITKAYYVIDDFEIEI